ncbi:hypothetical protein GCM10010300_22820 [Streptomyces olivaceoviridis]|nr:hypothetical protein GCM10010300_22820 [Streptomyces olivaceoviridis]
MTMQRDSPGESRGPEINPVPSREPVRVPGYELPHGEGEPGTACQVVYDGPTLDGTARQNLVAFAGPEARRLMAEYTEKNMRVHREEHERQGLRIRAADRGTRLPVRAHPSPG